MSMSILNLPQNERVITLPPVVTLQTVPQLLRKNNWLGLSVGEVDFSQVIKADSGALALLLAWHGVTKRPIKVRNLPSELQTLIPLYDLETTLTII